MSKSGDRCPFCREEGTLTREHLFAGWVDELYPDMVKETSSATLYRDGETKKFAAPPLDLKVRAVCGRCNNGWMSQCETAASPILGPMVRDGKWTRLRPPAQRIVASWAVKTALVSQYLHPSNHVIAESVHHSFYVEKRPLKQMMVFIGMRSSLYDKTGTAQFFDLEGTHVQRGRYNGVEVDEVRRLVDEGSRVYRVILTIGHLVLVVIGHTFPKGIVIEIPPKLRRTVIPIWPVIKSTVWPPPEPIDEIGGMDGLNKAFT